MLPILSSHTTSFSFQSVCLLISQYLSDQFLVCVSYCPILHQFVESFTDLSEVGSEGAVGVVQFGQELWVGVMVEDVVDATVGFWGQVCFDQLQQQIPAAGQELLHHGFVKSEVHLGQSGDINVRKNV